MNTFVSVFEEASAPLRADAYGVEAGLAPVLVDESDFAAWDRELGASPVPDLLVEQHAALGAIMTGVCDAAGLRACRGPRDG